MECILRDEMQNKLVVALPKGIHEISDILSVIITCIINSI